MKPEILTPEWYREQAEGLRYLAANFDALADAIDLWQAPMRFWTAPWRAKK